MTEAEGYKLHLLSRNATGYAGVFPDGSGTFCVQYKDKPPMQGFRTAVEATVAYAKAAAAGAMKEANGQAPVVEPKEAEGYKLHLSSRVLPATLVSAPSRTDARVIRRRTRAQISAPSPLSSGGGRCRQGYRSRERSTCKSLGVEVEAVDEEEVGVEDEREVMDVDESSG